MVNLSYQDRNLSMSIAIIYTQHYIITPAIPILNHQRSVLFLKSAGSFTRKSNNKKVHSEDIGIYHLHYQVQQVLWD